MDKANRYLREPLKMQLMETPMNNKRNRYLGKILLPVFVISFLVITANAQQRVSKIAFGSCGKQDHPLPVFNVAAKYQPDLFIFLGDNIYGDTDNMDTLRAKYARLAAKPSFQNLKSKTRLLATWDDHDFGRNDAGRHYPFKEQSKEIFLEFFEEALGSDRRKHPGIYTSYQFNTDGKILQIIMLDVRTFRDNLRLYKGEKKDKKFFYDLDYLPYETSDSTLLGGAQWAWLEQELRKPADLRLICSGSQFGIEFNGYEAWANFPHEQKRMLDIIKTNRANGVIFLTGDVHYAEISKMTADGIYPVYDATSSGLSSTWDFATPNKNRIKGPVMENHFGLLTIDWNKPDPVINIEVRDVKDRKRIAHEIKLSEISFPSN